MDKKMHLLRVGQTFDIGGEENERLRFLELLEILKKYGSTINEIAIFTGLVHTPYKLNEIRRRAEIIKERLEQARVAGFKAGINPLTTIGHHPEDLEYSLGDKYTFMTGENGDVCTGSYCLANENYLNEYVVPLYTILAKTEPEFILIDDDIRYGHMPMGFGCFCNDCIDKFNKKHGYNFTRQSLVEKLNGGDVLLRKQWLDKQSADIENILKVIGDTVRSVDKNIILGMMTGERYAEGYRFDKWAYALSDGGKYEIMWRPGGGAYNDFNFNEIVDKVEQCGRQNAYLPECVSKIQYEIENFPYQVTKKTPYSTAIEAAWAMTNGCTGAAFNIVPWESNEPLSVIVPHFKAVADFEPLYDLLNEKTAGKRPVGISTAWKQDSLVSVPNGAFINDWGGKYAEFAKEIFDLGFPQAYHTDNSVLTFMKGEFGKNFSDKELTDILSGGVYADTLAVEYLNSRGFSALTGCKRGKQIPTDATEIYTNDDINDGIIKGKRNCRQTFNLGDSFEVIATANQIKKLTSLVDYHDKVLADCAFGVYENECGGRIAVSGYYPFTWLSDFYKFTQLKNLFRYLSDNKLPSYVDSLLRIRNHTFIDGQKTVVALLNSSNQLYENVVLAIKGDKNKVEVFDAKGVINEVDRHKFDGHYSFFNITEILPYNIIVVEG